MSEEQDQHPEWFHAEASDIPPDCYFLVVDAEPLIGPFSTRKAARAYPILSGEERMIITSSKVLEGIYTYGPVPLARPVWRQ
jgi:hypothetical protein